MIYNAVYFDEENQKVRWTQTAPEGFKFNYVSRSTLGTIRRRQNKV